MATKTRGWLQFIVIAAAALVLLGGGLLTGSFFFLRNSLQDFEAADRSLEAVVERHGGIAEYRPQPDGAIAAERLEAFLAVRSEVGARRTKLEDSMSRMSGGKLAKTRGTVGMIRNLAPFHLERNEALMRSDVSLGEYYYLYTLAYYAWLGKTPADGPPFKLVGENGYVLETVEPMEESAVRAYREEHARRSLNQLLLPVLRRQLEDLVPYREEDEHRAWAESLEAEIAAMEADPLRLPWEGAVPETLKRSFRPYRDRLDDSYSTMCNALEIGIARRS